MSVVDRAVGWLRDRIGYTVTIDVPGERARPGQALEGAQWMYAPGSVRPEDFAQFALNIFANTAIDKLATVAAMARINIVSRTDITRHYADHPLLDLIGFDGSPNDAQDSVEFLVQHWQTLDSAGNCFWLWISRRGGTPNEVYQIPPTQIEIVPGSNRTIAGYIYRPASGQEIRLTPEQVTHFKRPSPYSIYWGMSPLQILTREIASDSSMVKWNRDFFEAGTPAGVLIVPQSTTDTQMKAIDDDFNHKHRGRRHVLVARGEPGSAVWLDAGLRQKDLDFNNGRILNRQTVFDRLDLHVGLLSESSTEAHARVARAMVYESIWNRHFAFDSRMTVSALPFWGQYRTRRVQHEDVRRYDWQSESLRLTAVREITTINERRESIGLRPVEWGEHDSTTAGAAPDEDRGDSDPVRESDDGQGEELLEGDD